MIYSNYIRCERRDVPSGVRFDASRVHAGASVVVEYGTFGRYEAADGAPYKRGKDLSGQSTELPRDGWTYYRLIGSNDPELDPDAQCPTHGSARWRCDAEHNPKVRS